MPEPVLAGSAQSSSRKDVLRSVMLALSLFMALLSVIYALMKSLPVMEAEETAIIHEFPTTNMSTLLRQREVLLRYANTNPVLIGAVVFLLYVAMQSFAIPGTLTLSVMSGALYGTIGGLLFVSVVCTVGATSCYLLSSMVGTALARAVWPGKTEEFAKEVNKRRSDIFSYMIFLRVTPILPNTFINVVAPIVKLPLLPFILGTFFGCMPNNLIAVNAGSKLTELKSFADLYDFKGLLLGLGIGVMALLSIGLKKRSKKPHAQ